MQAGRAGGLLVAPVLWGAWFVALYALNHVLCMGGAHAAGVGLLLPGLTAGTALVALVLAVRCARHARAPRLTADARFAASLAAALHGVAALTMPVIAWPLLVLPPCV